MSRKEVRSREALKLRGVEAVALGEATGVAEVREEFGIAGTGTVQRWLRTHGRDLWVSQEVPR